MMYTCPDDEIHSVYLDGELPQAVLRKYEAHIASCEKCQAVLSRLRSVQDMLQRDAKSITPDNVFIEQSWGRLAARRRYSGVIRKSRSAYSTQALWRAIPAMAAAAVVAVVLPLRATNASKEAASSAPIAAIGQDGHTLLTSQLSLDGTPMGQLFDMGTQAGVGQGFNSAQNVAGWFDNSAQTAMSSLSLTGTAGGQQSAAMAQGGFLHRRRHGASPFASRGMSNISGGISVGGAMMPVDAFRPNLDDGKTINIRITVPSIDGKDMLDNAAYATIRIPAELLNKQTTNE